MSASAEDGGVDGEDVHIGGAIVSETVYAGEESKAKMKEKKERLKEKEKEQEAKMKEKKERLKQKEKEQEAKMKERLKNSEEKEFEGDERHPNDDEIDMVGPMERFLSKRGAQGAFMQRSFSQTVIRPIILPHKRSSRHRDYYAGGMIVVL